MTIDTRPENRLSAVAVYLPGRTTPPHETQVHRALTARIAALSGLRFDGDYAPARHDGQPLYVVPAETLGAAAAQRLRIRTEADLFGGVVPIPFVATKLITHGLVGPGAAAPAGWAPAFAQRVEPAVLAGYSAFTRADASVAGLRLLQAGPVRLKPASARGGRGQTVVRDASALDAALGAMDDAEFADDGLVLEEDLSDAATYSVGQIRTPALTASYYGTQRLTFDNAGLPVYGGSELAVVRGSFADLLEQVAVPTALHGAVAQARLYDDAASDCFEGFFASRRNYDVVAGTNGRGQQRCGVLEQSWRIGGASGAEVAALDAFVQHGAQGLVQAACVERFGAGAAADVPPGATLLFQGDDPEVGFVTKYAFVADRAGARQSPSTTAG